MNVQTPGSGPVAPGSASGPGSTSGGSRAQASAMGMGDASPPDQTPEAGEREPSAPSTVGNRDLRHDPASGSYAPTPPPGDHGRGGVEAPTRVSDTVGTPPTDSTPPSVARWGSAPPPPRATERSRPDGKHPGRGVATAGREPLPGEPGYMAWIAELSARPGWTLPKAFAYAKTRRP